MTKALKDMTIIDGTNLLWALHEQSDEWEITTEAQLCRTLDRYFRSTGEDGQVVFDGTGPSGRDEFSSMSNLEVIFSGFNTDSDTVIEEKIKASTAPRRLTVVSSDRRLRKAAGERKAVALKSEEFWGQVQKELRRKKPQSKEPEAKREGLTQGETEQWMDLFDIDE
jgi:predicted RNA-binding protein with PIN domain